MVSPSQRGDPYLRTLLVHCTPLGDLFIMKQGRTARLGA
ncbi:hypothetical protein BSU04_02635 [Caballeronia sordidicola]|uniref:Uncharacterized protein n=1 Tax=Caballeronia sordidicola TaxID=196367 RepID=A0A226X9K6_CABSO|nr:hypothetical protein BSU04_02635 [Caballeronia sordidicola]